MNAPTRIIPDAELIAYISSMDTLRAAELISRAWEQLLANAPDDDHGQLSHVMQDGNLVCTATALDQAWADLRDLREEQLQSLPDWRAELAADYRSAAL